MAGLDSSVCIWQVSPGRVCPGRTKYGAVDSPGGGGATILGGPLTV